MKNTISAKALFVLRVIAEGRPSAKHCHSAKLSRDILTIGNYKFFVRSIAAFRAAACDNAHDRVVLEIFPGFEQGEALGIDLDGKVWVAAQDEANDWAETLTAKYFKEIPGMNEMVGHVLHMVELMLLNLTPAQIKKLHAAMLKTSEAPF